MPPRTVPTSSWPLGSRRIRLSHCKPQTTSSTDRKEKGESLSLSNAWSIVFPLLHVAATGSPFKTLHISTILSICNLVLLVLSSLYSAFYARAISEFLLLPYFQAYQVRQSVLGHRHFPRENSQIFYVNVLTRYSLRKSNAFQISLAEETKFS